LIELLVAMAVMSLILVGTLQVLTNTSKAIKIADNQREAGSASRTALDRFTADFSTAMLTGGATAIFLNDGKNSQIGFLCLSRTRGPDPNPRAAVIAYGVLPTTETISGQSVTYGSLQRGDSENTYTGQFANIFTDLPSTSNPGNWEPVGSGVVRFHISFVLDDGTIVQAPTEYTMISPQSGNPTTFLNGKTLAGTAISFSSNHAPASGRYVKSLIVGVACADPIILAQASAAGKLDEVQSILGTPSANGQTPLALWQSNLGSITFPPLRQSLRFYQRTIPIP
jgi:type II secretory pathway pseudopilin PulG